MTLAAGAAALAALTACGDTVAPSSGTLSDVQIAADVGATSGDAIAGDVLDFAGDLGVAGVASIASLATTDGAIRASVAAATSSGCPYDAASQTHVCSSVTDRGLAVTRTYQFLDAAGTPMQNYDAANTASIVFTRTADGTVTATTSTGVTWTGATHRADQRTVSGLLGTETQRVWNGSGQSHDTTDYSGNGGTRHYAGSTLSTTKDVVMRLPHSTYPYPQSGTITRSVNFTLTTTGGAAGDVTKTVTRTVTVTFNGTALVPMQVNNVNCTLDLATHRVSGCARSAT